MFASAESFAHLLEENEGAGEPGSGTSQALANKDRARKSCCCCYLKCPLATSSGALVTEREWEEMK